MSKAFTRESDDEGDEQRPLVRPALPPGTRNYITARGAGRIKQQLEELKTKLGTGSETEQVERSIKRLQQILNSVVVAEIPADQTKVAFGAIVAVRDSHGEEEYEIVGVDEADPERGWISWLSPLARALLGGKAGDQVRFRTPMSEQELMIVSVRYRGG